ncbi:MAG: hypothetical protein ABSH56_18200 [Bryobacteraceae bacterium]|jgi:hypothetical protein
MEQKPIKRILAIDPFSRGVGFAVLEGPDELIDWGLKTTGSADNKKAVRRIKALIDRYQPDVLALENWESTGARRCRRVEILLNLIATGTWKGLRVRLVSRLQLHSIGPLPHVSTKFGRAELNPYLPPVRKPWMSEDDRMSIFDAVAFAVACFPPKTMPQEPSTSVQPDETMK